MGKKTLETSCQGACYENVLQIKPYITKKKKNSPILFFKKTEFEYMMTQPKQIVTR